jgi:Domain of unknown function (DUF1707)
MSEGPRRYPPSTMRASDADRDAVLTELGEHFQAGRLTSDELDERTGKALQARTFGELAPLTADLPPLMPDVPAGRPPARARPAWPLVPVVLGLVAVAAVEVAFSRIGFLGTSVHLVWLILILPLVARRMAARGRR